MKVNPSIARGFWAHTLPYLWVDRTYAELHPGELEKITIEAAHNGSAKLERLQDLVAEAQRTRTKKPPVVSRRMSSDEGWVQETFSQVTGLRLLNAGRLTNSTVSV